MQRCSITLAPFQVGADPPGPDPATKCRVPLDRLLAVVAALLHTQWGLLLMGKALACARERGPLLTVLSCSSLHPSRGSCRGYVWHAILRISQLSHVTARGDN